MTEKHDFVFPLDLDRSFWRSVEPCTLFDYPLRRLTADHDRAPAGVAVDMVAVGFGQRKFFICPRCEERRRDLFAYETGEAWSCRVCFGMQYESARTGRTKRAFQVALNDRARVLKQWPHASTYRRSGSWRRTHQAAKAQHDRAELRAMAAFFVDSTKASERRLGSLLKNRRSLERAIGCGAYLELLDMAGECLLSSLSGLRSTYDRLQPAERTNEVEQIECRVIPLESRRKQISEHLTKQLRKAA